MNHLLKDLALHCGLSLSQYWHLRLLLSVSLVPLLGGLYLAFFEKRERRKPSTVNDSSYSLWVGSDGRLVAQPRQQEAV